MRGAIWFAAYFLVSAVKIDIPIVMLQNFGCKEGKERQWEEEWHAIVESLRSGEVKPQGMVRMIVSRGHDGAHQVVGQASKRTMQIFVQFSKLKLLHKWEKNTWPQLYHKAKPLEDETMLFEFHGLNWLHWGAARKDQVVRVATYEIKEEHETDMLKFVHQFLNEFSHTAGFTFFAYAQTKALPHTTLFLETFDTIEHHDTYVNEQIKTGHEAFLAHPEGKPTYENTVDIMEIIYGPEERDVFDL